MVVAGAGLAHASTLAFVSKTCIPQGAGVVDCFANVTGGTAPYTFHWSDDPWDDGPGSEGYCNTGHADSVTVTVVDATGATISGTINFFCKGGPPR